MHIPTIFQDSYYFFFLIRHSLLSRRHFAFLLYFLFYPNTHRPPDFLTLERREPKFPQLPDGYEWTDYEGPWGISHSMWIEKKGEEWR